MKMNLVCIPGDGIGPEIVREAKKVLDKVGQEFGHEILFTDILMGGASIDVHGVPLTQEAIETAKASAQAEAIKANKAASKIEKFLED